MSDEDIDALIMDAASKHWTKIAVIIAKVYDGFAAQSQDVSKDIAHIIAERIYILVDHGRLACQGNMRRWRDADVKLPEKKIG